MGSKIQKTTEVRLYRCGEKRYDEGKRGRESEGQRYIEGNKQHKQSERGIQRTRDREIMSGRETDRHTNRDREREREGGGLCIYPP